MVRVARAGRSLNLVQLADVARELAMLDVPVVNTAHVGDSWKDVELVGENYELDLSNLEDEPVKAEKLEETEFSCCGNVESILYEQPEIPKDIEGSIPETFLLETSITTDEVEDVGKLNRTSENMENCNRDCSESQPDDGGNEDMSFAPVSIASKDNGSCLAQCETKTPFKVDTEDVYPLPEQVPGEEVQPYASRMETAGSHIQDDRGMTQRMVLNAETSFKAKLSTFTSAIEELQLRADLLVLRPNKGSGAVLIDRNDYKKKMESVLHDSSKFVLEDDCEDPRELEQQISTEVQFLLEGHFIDESTAHHLKPKGTQTAQL
nr:unnamed protein product [Fasciola hepatica]